MLALYQEADPDAAFTRAARLGIDYLDRRPPGAREFPDFEATLRAQAEPFREVFRSGDVSIFMLFDPGRRVSRIAVVTSSPPMVEGGHMVIARSLAQALREAGHEADIVVTPQNRFGRQASAYLATWLTDVGTERRAPHRSGDQPALSELRRAASAARVLAEPHDARVLRPVGPLQRGPEPAGRLKEAHPARARSTPPTGIC